MKVFCGALFGLVAFPLFMFLNIICFPYVGHWVLILAFLEAIFCLWVGWLSGDDFDLSEIMTLLALLFMAFMTLIPTYVLYFLT